MFGLLGGCAVLRDSSDYELFESELNKNSSLGKNWLGPKVDLETRWIGTLDVSPTIPILVMAGHADSQGIAGSGTAGESVAVKSKEPMNVNMSDELFWNLKVSKAVKKLGRSEGLNIDSYDPPNRTIHFENNPTTNWSVGAKHVRNGGYVLEIHFDSYGKDGHGSGLIPALSTRLNKIDESLAKSFGRYPLMFRGGLGAPKRGIRILEIGKLEGKLEENLRNPLTQEMAINSIANQIVQAIKSGIAD